MKIGNRVRELRNESGLSLREMGRRAGVTASFLSQVENDQVSPSLNSLQSIARALGVPMFSLLNDTPNGTVVRRDEARRITFEEPHISYDILTTDFSRQMMAYRIRIDPYGRRITQPLAKSTEQWMHILRGKMEIIIGDETYHLEAGDTIYYDGDLLREFGSISDEELTFLCCITPPVF